MDKIKRSLHITDWNVYNKLDELVEGYNEMKVKMSYYNELDRRLKRLEKIEVMRMLDNK